MDADVWKKTGYLTGRKWASWIYYFLFFIVCASAFWCYSWDQISFYMLLMCRNFEPNSRVFISGFSTFIVASCLWPAVWVLQSLILIAATMHMASVFFLWWVDHLEFCSHYLRQTYVSRLHRQLFVRPLGARSEKNLKVKSECITTNESIKATNTYLHTSIDIRAFPKHVPCTNCVVQIDNCVVGQFQSV